MNLRNIILAFGITVLVIMLFSCKSESESNPTSKTAEEDLKIFLTTYHDAMNQYGLKAEFNFLDSSDQFFWIPPGYSNAINFDSVKRTLLKTDQSIRRIHLKWKDLKVEYLKPDLANFHGIVEGEIIDTSGLLIKMNQIESGILIKRKSGWKILSGQSTALSNNRNFDPKSIGTVNMITVVVLPVGDYYIFTLDGKTIHAKDKDDIKRKLEPIMLGESNKKIKVFVSDEALYGRVHDLLSLFTPNSWIPVMSLLDLEK